MDNEQAIEYAKFWRNGVSAIEHIVRSKEVVERYDDDKPRKTEITFECGPVVKLSKLELSNFHLAWRKCERCIRNREARLRELGQQPATGESIEA